MLRIRWAVAGVFRAMAAKNSCASTASVWLLSVGMAWSRLRGCAPVFMMTKFLCALWSWSGLGYSFSLMLGCSSCTRIMISIFGCSSSLFPERWFEIGGIVLAPSSYRRGTRPSIRCGGLCINARVVAFVRWFSHMSLSTTSTMLVSDGHTF